MKSIHGKPRHPETQGSVERDNQDIKKHLTVMMLENNRDTNWVKYISLVQYRKNTNYHSIIGMSPLSPFQAVFNRKPPQRLSELGIPNELETNIFNECDVNMKLIDATRLRVQIMSPLKRFYQLSIYLTRLHKYVPIPIWKICHSLSCALLMKLKITHRR